MSQSLTLFKSIAVPARVAKFMEKTSNIQDRLTVPSLGVTGKVWTISLNGEKTQMMRRSPDGDVEPAQTVRVVILDAAPRRGRAYYPGAFDSNKPGAPECWSDDGIAPPATVPEPQSKTCATCPRAVKGSQITDNGKSVAACSTHLMLAVVPANRLDHPALRLKLAITSIWDKQSPDLAAQQWFAFDNFKEFLRSNGVTHTATIVTKMKFDPGTAYPKVIFSPDRWLTDEELDMVEPRVGSDEVSGLISGTWTPAGVDGKQIEAPKAAAVPAAKPVPSADPDDDGEEIPTGTNAKGEKVTMPAAEPVRRSPGRPAKAAEPAKPAPVIDADDDEGEVIPPEKPANGAKSAKTEAPAKVVKVSTNVPDDLASLMSDWDDE